MREARDPGRIYLYSRFERIWHWLQGLMILTLLLTGLEVHGYFSLLGYDTAVNLHNWAGITWPSLFVLFIFWALTTGQWRQFMPMMSSVGAMIRYYTFGIFSGEPHPFPKRPDAKHNPLQRLAYLVLATLLLPVQMITGILYWQYNNWAAYGLDWLSLTWIAALHFFCGVLTLAFVIVHVYMITTGHSLFAHMKAMLTGYEDVHEPHAADGSPHRAGRTA
jgi:thiosulfate reductase cytochrome b subunit